MNKSVLLYGKNRQLLELRGRVLRLASFSVTVLTRLGDLVTLEPEPPVDVLILCHTLSATEKRDAALLSRSMWARVKVIVLVSFAEEFAEPVGEPLRVAHGPHALVLMSRQMSGLPAVKMHASD